MKKIKSQIRSLINKMGYDIQKYENKDKKSEVLPDFTPEMNKTFKKVKPFTMTSQERIFALVNAVEYICKNNISGAFVECGVWKGGSMMAIAETLMRLQITNRELYLFDTFEGMPPAHEMDRSYRGEHASDLMKQQDPDSSLVWAIAQNEEVRNNIQSTKYPNQLVNYIQGLVEDTLPTEAPPKISLLRLDTDWYDSTLHELEHLYPNLVSGGVLIIDDYGHWEGAKRAVDEYFKKNNIPVLLSRIDYTGRIAVKP